MLLLCSKIHEYKGRQELFIRQKPARLGRLIEIARIQSTEASNRIEGIVTERLSMIMTLHDVGFTNEEVHQYMSLWVQGEATREERKKMLVQKRNGTLDEIHFKEKQLERLDYLWYEIEQERSGDV